MLWSSSILFIHLAPSSPRDVTARLVAPLQVEVKWRPPAAPNGDISHYYVYAIPLASSNTNNNPETIKMVQAKETIFIHVI